jgi:hypothetical protein
VLDVVPVTVAVTGLLYTAKPTPVPLKFTSGPAAPLHVGGVQEATIVLTPAPGVVIAPPVETAAAVDV